MTTALRPMDTGELLDRTFNIYRNNFTLFAGISALAAMFYVGAMLLLLVLGIELPRQRERFDPASAFSTLALYFLVLGLFNLIGASLATGATIYAVSKVHLGQSVTIAESYRKVLPLLGRIIRIVVSVAVRMVGVVILMSVVAFAIIFALTAGLRGRAAPGPGGPINVLMATGILVIVVIVGYFLAFRLYFVYSLAVQACLLEKADAGTSLKRSSFLTKGSLWRIFLIYLLMGIIGFVLGFVLQLPATLFVKWNMAFASTAWGLLATFAAVTLSFPISTIAISLVYYDQRVRKEAFDLQLMMESLGQSSPGQAAASAPIG